jgi:hypothetical protein
MQKPSDERANEQRKQPEIKEQSNTDRREKEVPITQQSSDEPSVEKATPRQHRSEVQNPLMHESY